MDDLGETQQEEFWVEKSNYVDDMAPAQRARVEPKAVEMDDLMSSFRQLAVGQPLASPQDNIDEQGVSEDYGENGAIDTGVAECNNEVLDKGNRFSPVGHMVIPRQKLMNMFRGDRHGAALLTRNYNSTGEDWREYVMNISVNEALRTRGKDAECVILKEFEQMVEKKVWAPVNVQRLPSEEKARIIRSSMFLKEKFLASGKFEKLKARLVAGGDQQDKTLYDDLPAPTVGTSSVFTLLSIAASEGRKVTAIDISGAYLNADMDTGLTVHMRLDKNMTGMMFTPYHDATCQY